MDGSVTLWLDLSAEDQSIIAQHLLESNVHCLNNGRTVSFPEFVATAVQFIAMVPMLSVDAAEVIYNAINRDYLNTICSEANERQAAGLLRIASDAVCVRGGHAPLFNTFE